MNGELSFFELGVGDADRARKFDGDLFGWDFVDEGTGATIKTPKAAKWARTSAEATIPTRRRASGASCSARTIRARASASISRRARLV